MFGTREVELNPVLPVAWITLADAKAWLGVTGTDDDTKIASLIDATAELVETYTGTIVSQRTVTERMYPEDPVGVLTLTHYPIVDLTSLTVDDEAETLAELRITNSAGMVRRKDGTALSGREMAAIYTAGYPSNAIPKALVNGSKELLRELYNSTGRDHAVAKESVPDVAAVEYRDGDSYFRSNGVAVSAPVAAMLAPFVRRRA